MKNTLNNIGIWIVASLTLGLAPWVPEPHVVGKLRWVLGGASGMGLMDWMDLLLHGLPWLLLIRAIGIRIRRPKNIPGRKDKVS
jgi:hypothetical protein